MQYAIVTFLTSSSPSYQKLLSSHDMYKTSQDKYSKFILYQPSCNIIDLKIYFYLYISYNTSFSCLKLDTDGWQAISCNLNVHCVVFDILAKDLQFVSKHCTLNTSRWKRHTAHSTLHTANSTSHISHYSMHTAHCTVHTA